MLIGRVASVTEVGATLTTTAVNTLTEEPWTLSPSYVAEMFRVPAERAEVFKTAEPELTVVVPSTPDKESRNTTMPLAGEGDTVAIKDIAVPKLICAGCATSVVVVDSALILTVTSVLVADKWLSSPE